MAKTTLVESKLASRGEWKFVHSNFEVMFRSGEIKTVELGRESNGRVDQKPVVGEL